MFKFFFFSSQIFEVLRSAIRSFFQGMDLTKLQHGSVCLSRELLMPRRWGSSRVWPTFWKTSREFVGIRKIKRNWDSSTIVHEGKCQMALWENSVACSSFTITHAKSCRGSLHQGSMRLLITLRRRGRCDSLDDVSGAPALALAEAAPGLRARPRTETDPGAGLLLACWLWACTSPISGTELLLFGRMVKMTCPSVSEMVMTGPLYGWAAAATGCSRCTEWVFAMMLGKLVREKSRQSDK